MPSRVPPSLTQFTGEVSAALGGAYESFVRARLERRQGRRGKVYARAAKSFVEWAVEMIEEGGSGGYDPEGLWHQAITELDHERSEIETDLVKRFGGPFEFEHEWGLFLEWSVQVRARLS